MSAISISELRPEGEAEWDRFVGSSPDGTFFHLSCWRRVIAKAFGHRTFYLCARRGDVLTGILPLTQVKSFLFGNAMISNAFCVAGGTVAVDAESHGALEAEAVKLATAENVD